MQKTIIVADDDRSILDAVTLLLENAHYKVESIIDGGGIMARVEKMLPDLVLLDISMGDTDGRDVCVALKKNKLVSHIPVIFMTANVGVESMAEKAGADGFISKPFSIVALLKKITDNLIPA